MPLRPTTFPCPQVLKKEQSSPRSICAHFSVARVIMTDSSTATRPVAPAPAVPYVGSRISLISKSAIRYVGTLYTIDTKASTVALKDVRSFGTEGRPREGGPIDPSDRVYSFIVFHGRDILDLQFLTTDAVPTPAPASPPAPDPAPDSAAEPPNSPIPDAAQHTSADPAPLARAPLRGPTPRAWGPPPAAPRRDPQTVLNQQYDRAPNGITNGPPNAGSTMASEPNGVAGNGQGRGHRDARPRGRARSAQGNGRNPAGSWRRGPGITIPAEDFDFASMQEKFDKASLVDKGGDSVDTKGYPQVEVRYDKSKSFFDELVPEKELRIGRYNAAQRRATDFETFGETGPGYHHNRSGYRNARGRRGRGRGRGRGRYGGVSAGTDTRGDTDAGRRASGMSGSR